MTGLNLQITQLSVALKGRFGPILSDFYVVFFPNCSLVCSTEVIAVSAGSVEVTYVTLQDGLNFPTTMTLVGSSALGLPMDCLRPIACDSLAI